MKSKPAVTVERTRCPYTGKVQYTRREAKDMAAKMRHDLLANVNHYQCKCKHWHVGNDSRKKSAKRKRW